MQSLPWKGFVIINVVCFCLGTSGVAVHDGGATLVRHVDAGGPVLQTLDRTSHLRDGIRNDVVRKVCNAARRQPGSVLPAVTDAL